MKREIVIGISIFICVAFINAQCISYKVDTVSCLGESIVIELPDRTRKTKTNYEEGWFTVYTSQTDTAFITIHTGSMVNLPLTKMSDKIITSILDVPRCIRDIRGYSECDGIRKYFREVNFYKESLNIVYENVSSDRLECYEHMVNNIKVLPE